MKYKSLSLLILIIVFFSGSSQAQFRYLVKFTDKGVKPGTAITFGSKEWKSAEKMLSKESIERRKKNMGATSYIDYDDLPLLPEYIKQVEKCGVQIHHKLKWFNAVSVLCNESNIDAIKKLSCVESVMLLQAPKQVDKESESGEQLVSISNLASSVINKQSLVDNSFELSIGKIDANINGKTEPLDYGSSIKQLSLSDIPLAHSKGFTGKGVKIGVLDSGFDYKDHEAFNFLNVLAARDFVFDDDITANESNDLPGQHNHGTYCLSVIGGLKNGKLIGVSFGSSFALAKTENTASESKAEEENYACALEWLDSIGVDITTSSLGYTKLDNDPYNYRVMNGENALSSQAAEKAYKKGILLLTAAGNEGNENWHFMSAPADSKNIIAVGAVTYSKKLAYFSSRGPSADGRIKPDVSTMGVNIFGVRASTKDGYENSNGTSAATPIAAGIAGLVLEAFPHLKNTQLRYILTASSPNFANPDSWFGNGILSAKRAIEYPNLSGSFENGLMLHKVFFASELKNAKVYIDGLVSNGNHLKINGEKGANDSYIFALPKINKGESISFSFHCMVNDKEIIDSLTNGVKFRINHGCLDVLRPSESELIKTKVIVVKDKQEMLKVLVKYIRLLAKPGIEANLYRQVDGNTKVVYGLDDQNSLVLYNKGACVFPMTKDYGNLYFMIRNGDKMYYKQNLKIEVKKK